MKNILKKFTIAWCVRTISLCAIFTLWGCASGAYVIPSVSIPSPLIDSFPMTVGIYYPPELNEPLYNDKIGRQIFVVESGDSQEHVFNTCLGGLFEETVTLESPDPKSVTVDGVFIPNIPDQGVTLQTPAGTGTEYYEILIRYNISLFDVDGDEIHKWTINAYGKVNRRDYGSVMERTSEAIQQATENALRDACTQFIEKFNPNRRSVAVSDWLKTGYNRSSE